MGSQAGSGERDLRIEQFPEGSIALPGNVSEEGERFDLHVVGKLFVPVGEAFGIGTEAFQLIKVEPIVNEPLAPVNDARVAEHALNLIGDAGPFGEFARIGGAQEFPIGRPPPENVTEAGGEFVVRHRLHRAVAALGFDPVDEARRLEHRLDHVAGGFGEVTVFGANCLGKSEVRRNFLVVERASEEEAAHADDPIAHAGVVRRSAGSELRGKRLNIHAGDNQFGEQGVGFDVAEVDGLIVRGVAEPIGTLVARKQAEGVFLDVDPDRGPNRFDVLGNGEPLDAEVRWRILPGTFGSLDPIQGPGGTQLDPKAKRLLLVVREGRPVPGHEIGFDRVPERAFLG